MYDILSCNMIFMDKNKTLKNSSQDISVDTKKREKESNILDDISDSGKLKHDDESTNSKTSDESYDSAFDSDNFNLDLAVLNEVSRIAHMGMSSISFLTNRIYDIEMKKMLVAMYSQYSNILSQVNEHFEKYGEVPSDTSLFARMMSFCGIKKDLYRDNTTSHIAEMMIQGTLMGVIEVQKILNANLDLRESTKDLLKKFNKFQRENIDKLNAYL